MGYFLTHAFHKKLLQVFESVIAWIQHSVEARAQHLPSLMEHIRLPLLSQDYLIHKVCLNKVFNAIIVFK